MENDHQAADAMMATVAGISSTLEVVGVVAMRCTPDPPGWTTSRQLGY